MLRVLLYAASYFTATLLEHKGNLEALAGVRGALVARVCAIPQVTYSANALFPRLRTNTPSCRIISRPQETSVTESAEDAAQYQAIARVYLPSFIAAVKQGRDASKVLSSVRVPTDAASNTRVPQEWPSAGHVIVRDLQVRLRISLLMGAH